MNDKLVQVRVRNVYGVDKFYPVNDAAKVFASIARQTTLTDEVVRQIKQLGYMVEAV